MSEIIKTAIVYSCIAFSIVFIVLGGLTVVIYAMRLTTGSKTPSAPAPGAGAGPVSSGQAVPIAAVDVKAQHVAAIAAAVLAATRGRGRVLSIFPAPASAQGQGNPSLTSRWRSAAIIENVGRHLSPSWKR
jgi:Na+-transporting methylmalonyl-CoA/oxaloacetate decarboxylase gamma subunit